MWSVGLCLSLEVWKILTQCVNAGVWACGAMPEFGGVELPGLVCECWGPGLWIWDFPGPTVWIYVRLWGAL